MLCTRLLNMTCCIPMGHGTDGFAFRQPSRYQYGALWYALDHIEKWSTVARFQLAFSQRGVRVSFEHPFADFGHPNIHMFCVYCNGMKRNWTHNSPQMCIFGQLILKSWLWKPLLPVQFGTGTVCFSMHSSAPLARYGMGTACFKRAWMHPMVFVPFRFSTEHHYTALTPFWFSPNDTHTCTYIYIVHVTYKY